MQEHVDITKIRNIFIDELFVPGDVDEKTMRVSASYFLLHQLVIYRLLERHEKYNNAIPPLNEDAIKEPSDIDDVFFKRLLHVTGHFEHVFGISLGTSIQDVGVLKGAIASVNALFPERVEGDFLGKVFHQLIPADIRKRVASYYTLEEGARLLASLAIGSPDQHVCDPACGSGVLLTAAYTRKRELTQASRNFTPRDHERLVSRELLGIDIMPYAVHLAAIQLSLKDLSSPNAAIQVSVSDSLLLNHVNREFDVVLMNPPFTKKQRLTEKDGTQGLPRNYKERVKENFEPYFERKILHGASPFFAYFMCIADKILGTTKAGTGPKTIGAVVPVIILRNDSEKELRKYLYEKYWFKYIVVREDAYNFSEDTQLRECLIILEKNGQETLVPRHVSYVFLHELDGDLVEGIVRSLLAFLTEQRRGEEGFFNHVDPAFSVLTIPQDQVDANTLFFPVALFSFNHDYYMAWSKLRDLHPFSKMGDLNGIKVISKNQPEPARIGLKFKQTSLLVEDNKKDKGDVIITRDAGNVLELQGNRSKNEVIKVDKGSCRPMIRYISKKKTMDLSCISEYVLSAPVSEMPGIDGDWDEWGRFLDARTANMVLVDRLDFTTEGYHLLAFFSQEPRVVARSTAAIRGLDDITAKFLVMWFNSSFGILEWLLTRAPQRFGYCQHHGFTMNELAIPLGITLDGRRIDSTFDTIKDVEFPSFTEQFARLMPVDIKNEFENVLAMATLPGGTRLLDVACAGFPPRQLLDAFMLDVVAGAMDEKNRSKLFIALRHRDGTPWPREENVGLADIKDQSVTLLANLHSRVARVLLASKRAMDE